MKNMLPFCAKMRYVCLIVILFLSAGLRAQESRFSVDGDFLTRGEIRSGGLSTNEEGETEDFAAFVFERSLLKVDYNRPGLSANFSVQHNGTWGSSNEATFDIYEAWVSLNAKSGLFAKIGRQNLVYDDQRIFGTDDWTMTARAHDVLKIGYEGHGHRIHLIAGYNQNPANMKGGTYYSGGIQPYKSMQSIWYHLDVPGTKLGISAVFMNAGMQGTAFEKEDNTYFQQLVGGYLSFKPKQWSVEGAYYYQMGKSESSLPINAWMGCIKAGYETSGRNTYYAGYDYLSGDRNFATPPYNQIGVIRHKTIRGFSSLYGSHHKFYGAMDFFYVSTYYRGFTPGLQNVYAGGAWKVGDKTELNASYHFLATATKLQNAKKPLGHELELSGSYKLFKDCKLSAGYSFMWGTRTMVVLKRSSDRRRLHWGWLMLSVTPRFFTYNGK